MRGLDDHPRPLLDLVVDAAHVLAHDAEREQLDAAEQRDEDDDRRVACREVLRARELEDQVDQCEQERGEREQDAGHRDEVQRPAREPDHAVHADEDRAEERVVLRLAGLAGVAVVEHRCLAEADEADESAQEAMGLVERDDVVDHAAGHQAEVAGVRRDVDLGDAVDDLVAQRGDNPLGQRLALARAALGVDHVEALAPEPHHVGDQLRRVLQVTVDHDRGLARRIKTRRHQLAQGPAESRLSSTGDNWRSMVWSATQNSASIGAEPTNGAERTAVISAPRVYPP